MAYILVAVGIVGLVSQTFYRLQRERDFLQQQMQSQQRSLIEGLKSDWKKYLLDQARKGNLEKTFKLNWNRKGSETRDIFFPVKTVQYEWSEYREFERKGNNKKIENFLRKALLRKNSWDRVLAITEWKNQFGDWPLIYSKYENTIVNAEAKLAYQQIFEQFSGKKDFTFSSRQIVHDIVFYSVTSDGSIEAFVPSLTNVKNEHLPHFLKSKELRSAILGSNPWDIVFSDSFESKQNFSYLEFLGILFSLLSVVIGLFVYIRGLRGQKMLLLKRVSFLNQVVHELKTPLAGLKLHLQLIQRGGAKKENLEALDLSIDRLNQLFDDVVLMNKPFEKVKPVVIEPKLANEIFSALNSEFPNLEIKDNVKTNFLADQKRLSVILRNLVKNAIRYGDVATLSTMVIDGALVIEVSDRGPGVPEEESEKIFDEFYRSDEAKRKNADGLGLGLFLVKKMSEEMEAKIELCNPGEKGAKFQLWLKEMGNG